MKEAAGKRVNMQAYTGFAQVYDIFMDNVPYDEWTGYLAGLLQEYGVREGLVLELGCGTGKITRRLAAKGYDMIGVDISEEMLEIAREKEYDEALEFDGEDIPEPDSSGDFTSEAAKDRDSFVTGSEMGTEQPDLDKRSRILYLQQDMREFELYGTVGAVVSICDSMNYITSEEDLLKVFRLVNNYLDPGGIFIFDMNTEYKYKHVLGDSTIAENREDCSFIWENNYDEVKQINEYNVTIFVKIEKDDIEEDDIEEDNIEQDDIEADDMEEDALREERYGYPDLTRLFERFMETHYQKAYSTGKVKQLMERAGLEFVAVYDAFTRNLPGDTSERVYFIAREKYQENKKYI